MDSTLFMTDLSAASRRMRAAFDDIVRKRGLTFSRARALVHISRHQDINQTELARLLEMKIPTAGRLLDGMEKHGLIERKSIGDDRRIRQIALTPTARRQIESIEQVAVSLGDAMLCGATCEETEIAVKVLRQVANNLETPTKFTES